MRYWVNGFMVLLISMFVSVSTVSAKPIDEYIGEAEALRAGGNLHGAVTVMRDALKEYPEHPAIMAYLGGYLIMQAGEETDPNRQGTLFFESVEHLDRAVEADDQNPVARFYRGIAGIQSPDFLGRLEQGVTDTEMFISIYRGNPAALPVEMFVAALDNLGTGYDKQGDYQKAYDTWSEILRVAPGTPLATQVEERLMNYMTSPERIEATSHNLALDNPKIAALTKQVEQDPDNARLVYELAMVYGEEADKGYDERVYEDTTFRTNLAFTMTNLLDRAAKLAPDDMEIRLACGTCSVSMPFFVNRLDRGIEDLEAVIEGRADEEQKAEAHFWLGYAYQKKATTEWVEVVTDYPNAAAAAMTFDWIAPPVREFDRADYDGPVAVIDFVLGFRDELAPQTAVWIENDAGEFVRTIYVSGFSGYAKDRQIDLPRWAEASDFADTDGVTGASIDIGSHCYVWNLKDYHGNTVVPGRYTVRVETMYWPSMKYQSEAVEITVGNEESRASMEKGHFIPWLKATFYP